MLFKKPEYEEISIDSIDSYIIRLFDEKTKRINEKCSWELLRIKDALSSFKEACAEFGKANFEPEAEFIGSISKSSVIEQKPRYVFAIISSINMLEQNLEKASAQTEYEKFLSIKWLLDNFLEHILKLNASFRVVFMGYGDKFGKMKSTFKELENSIKSLSMELDRGTEDLSSHLKIYENITRLRSLMDELNMLSIYNQDIGTASLQDDLSKQIVEYKSKIESLNTQLYDNQKKKQAIINELDTVLKPIERAARKYDYESKNKFKLTNAIEDPIHVLSDNAAYVQFLNSLKDLETKIDHIEENKREISIAKNQIGTAIGADIQTSILEYEKLNDVESSLTKEMQDCKSVIEELSSRKTNEDILKNQKSLNAKKISNIRDEIGEVTAQIAELVYSSYRKRIKILGVSA
ncbi:MAG: hypothetical protein ACP5TL_01370 [Candidatus Micrarchaeia archaeon]